MKKNDTKRHFGKLVDCERYCNSKNYLRIRNKDLADAEARNAMAELGYMQLMTCKYEYDKDGNSVVDKLQFVMNGAKNSPILMFNSWKGVRLFIEGERMAISILRT